MSPRSERSLRVTQNRDLHLKQQPRFFNDFTSTVKQIPHGASPSPVNAKPQNIDFDLYDN